MKAAWKTHFVSDYQRNKLEFTISWWAKQRRPVLPSPGRDQGQSQDPNPDQEKKTTYKNGQKLPQNMTEHYAISQQEVMVVVVFQDGTNRNLTWMQQQKKRRHQNMVQIQSNESQMLRIHPGIWILLCLIKVTSKSIRLHNTAFNSPTLPRLLDG